jgi:hypothetical protein
LTLGLRLSILLLLVVGLLVGHQITLLLVLAVAVALVVFRLGLPL